MNFRGERVQSSITMVDNNGEKYIRKVATERGIDDLSNQVNFIARIPHALKEYYPKITRLELNSSSPFYEMPFYGQNSVRDLLLGTEKESNEISEIVNNVLTFMVNQHHPTQKKTAPQAYISKVYIERAFRRIQTARLLASDFDKMLEKETVIWEDDEYGNGIALLTQLANDQSFLSHLNPKQLHFTHGQLEFAHIISVPDSKEKFILLDPKGTGPLDAFYDFGKLYQSVVGFHDWVEEGMVKFNNIQLSTNSFMVAGQTFSHDHRLAVLDEIKLDLENNLIELLNMPREEVLLRLTFSTSMHLFGFLPYAFGMGGNDSLYAGYLFALKLLSSLIEMRTA